MSSREEADWSNIQLVIECVPEQLDLKQRLFKTLVELALPDTVLCSNSSSYPISQIAKGLSTQNRMLGLHFFMPAHIVPLVEVVLGPDTRSEEKTSELQSLMRTSNAGIWLIQNRMK